MMFAVAALLALVAVLSFLILLRGGAPPPITPTEAATALPTYAPIATPAPTAILPTTMPTDEAVTPTSPPISGAIFEVNLSKTGHLVDPKLTLVHITKYNTLTDEMLASVEKGSFSLVVPLPQYLFYTSGGKVNLATKDGHLNVKAVQEFNNRLKAHHIKWFVLINGLPNFGQHTDGVHGTDPATAKFWSSNNWANYRALMQELVKTLGNDVLGYQLGSELQDDHDSLVTMVHPELGRPTTETEAQTLKREQQLFDFYFQWLEVVASGMRQIDPRVSLWAPGTSTADLSEGRILNQTARSPGGEYLNGLTFDDFGPAPHFGAGALDEEIQRMLAEHLNYPDADYAANLAQLTTDALYATRSGRPLGASLASFNIDQSGGDKANFLIYADKVYHSKVNNVYIAKTLLRALKVQNSLPISDTREVWTALWNLAADGQNVNGLMDLAGKPFCTFYIEQFAAQLTGSKIVALGKEKGFEYAATIATDGTLRIFLTSTSFTVQDLNLRIRSTAAFSHATIQTIASAKDAPILKELTFKDNILPLHVGDLDVILITIKGK